MHIFLFRGTTIHHWPCFSISMLGVTRTQNAPTIETKDVTEDSKKKNGTATSTQTQLETLDMLLNSQKENHQKAS